MNIEDDKLAKDSVLLNRGCGSALDKKRKNIFGTVKELSTSTDAVETVGSEKKFKFILSNLLTRILSDRER